MSDIITLLPDHVANQIAAGEVVQRPASVVKELLENAIDAKASKVQLIIKEAGKVLIQVIDDGIGMSETDARMAFERHATSKINTANDLFALHTKGFRGEALASIAAVSKVELLTRRSADELATKLTLSGSEVVGQEPTVGPVGSALSVSNLFFNVPARRNFLKSNTVELRHIIDEFHRVALAHPDIAFTLYQGGNEIFDLPVDNLRKRIGHIFGNKIDDKLVPVQEKTPVVEIQGFVLKPTAAKRTRGQQFFFVNNRFIKSPFLHHAVMQAFEGLIGPGTYPGYFLFMTLDPKSIDINIHPTKTEVKFEEEQSLYAILKSSIKHSLGMFQISPTLDFERDPNLDLPYKSNTVSPTAPRVEVDRSFNPFKEKAVQKFSSKVAPAWEGLYQDTAHEQESSPSLMSKMNFGEELTHGVNKIFQIMNRFVISSSGSALLIVDQSKAHQRILYEQFLANFTQQNAVSQQLLFPVVYPLEGLQIGLYKEFEEILVAIGFQLSIENKTELHIKAIPSFCQEKEVSTLLDELFSELAGDTPKDSFSQSDILAKSLSKSLCIKTGKPLKVEEQQQLLDDLFACKDPQVSPFNQQIFVSLTKEELEQKFSL